MHPSSTGHTHKQPCSGAPRLPGANAPIFHWPCPQTALQGDPQPTGANALICQNPHPGSLCPARTMQPREGSGAAGSRAGTSRGLHQAAQSRVQLSQLAAACSFTYSLIHSLIHSLIIHSLSKPLRSMAPGQALKLKQDKTDLCPQDVSNSVCSQERGARTLGAGGNFPRGGLQGARSGAGTSAMLLWQHVPSP
uniref:Uncharacterized protein n=1 Tax=Myotis myotis TaxID=51298 RepID=A0A7J7ZXV3_MYOMY|nr:hypothetical protein mMyoMyo1_009774 [Myotis myotis]